MKIACQRVFEATCSVAACSDACVISLSVCVRNTQINPQIFTPGPTIVGFICFTSFSLWLDHLRLSKWQSLHTSLIIVPSGCGYVCLLWWGEEGRGRRGESPRILRYLNSVLFGFLLLLHLLSYRPNQFVTNVHKIVKDRLSEAKYGNSKANNWQKRCVLETLEWENIRFLNQPSKRLKTHPTTHTHTRTERHVSACSMVYVLKSVQPNSTFQSWLSPFHHVSLEHTIGLKIMEILAISLKYTNSHQHTICL